MYLTFIRTQKPYQLTIEDWLMDITRTETKKEYPQFLTVEKGYHELHSFFESHVKYGWYLIPKHPKYPTSELNQHYEHFKIPKKSGGLRDIDAPDEELKKYLSELKWYFEETLGIKTHNCAHAYVKERSTITAVQEHQENNSYWFLKLDLKNFFPSHTIEYVLGMLQNIYPIGYLMEDPEYKKNLKEALEYAFLDNKLPQGTPLSPTLTNILMTPIDYEIQHKLWEKKSSFVYTRYADDMCISSKYNFSFKEVEKVVENAINKYNAPFYLNKEKTHYGSRCGRNWNLGIMLNKDNELTIGHKQNQRFRAMLNNLIRDYKNSIFWTTEDKQVLSGLIAYYIEIQPERTKTVLQNYENKFSVSIKEILKY